VDWTNLLRELTATGFTQKQIAERCGVAQSTISDLQRGASKEPSYQLGARLVAMHAEQVRERCVSAPLATEVRDAA
jgi:predicted XRE-type DNA-binding protein